MAPAGRRAAEISLPAFLKRFGFRGFLRCQSAAADRIRVRPVGAGGPEIADFSSSAPSLGSSTSPLRARWEDAAPWPMARLPASTRAIRCWSVPASATTSSSTSARFPVGHAAAAVERRGYAVHGSGAGWGRLRSSNARPDGSRDGIRCHFRAILRFSQRHRRAGDVAAGTPKRGRCRPQQRRVSPSVRY